MEWRSLLNPVNRYYIDRINCLVEHVSMSSVPMIGWWRCRLSWLCDLCQIYYKHKLKQKKQKNKKKLNKKETGKEERNEKRRGERDIKGMKVDDQSEKTSERTKRQFNDDEMDWSSGCCCYLESLRKLNNHQLAFNGSMSLLLRTWLRPLKNEWPDAQTTLYNWMLMQRKVWLRRAWYFSWIKGMF